MGSRQDLRLSPWAHIGLLAHRVRWSFGMLLTQRDTYRDLDEGRIRPLQMSLTSPLFGAICLADIFTQTVKNATIAYFSLTIALWIV